MPEGQSVERRKMMQMLGAEVEMTPKSHGMRGAIQRAEELTHSLPDAIMPQQFHNQANPDIHEQTTAEEIWRDTGGELDVLVLNVGTGGTLTGCARALKARRPTVRVIAVEPEDSAVLSGGAPGPHMIEGIGAGFVPSILDTSLIDEVLTVANQTAFDTARRCARLEGIPPGISSGAVLTAALEIAARPAMAGKRIVVVLPSFAERYLSTPLFERL